MKDEVKAELSPSPVVAHLRLVRSMKRWVISGALILLVGYIIAYRFVPWRDAGRFRKC